MSHLLQMRGVKQKQKTFWTIPTMSHLLQMRGLKPDTIQLGDVRNVASFTDAWIETFKMILVNCQNQVASFTDAWIETT